MASPKLKLYALPPTYTEQGDDDVRLLEGDELLPVVPKEEALETVKGMTGVWPSYAMPCYPIDFTGGIQEDDFVQASGKTYVPANVDPTDITVGPSGQLSFKVYDDARLLGTNEYDINLDNDGLFESITFDANPSGTVTGAFYARETPITARYWALPADNPYDGNNAAVAKFLVQPSGEDFPDSDPPQYDLYAANGVDFVLAGPSGSLIDLGATDRADGVYVSYWWRDPVSQYFASEHSHWVQDHMRLNPDIFVGTRDYPGDQGEIEGEPFVQGVVPQYREIGTYQINYNEGWVKFPERVDSRLTPVKANYSFIPGIRQLKRARLEVVGGTGNLTWRLPAVPTDWPEAYAKPFVNRSDKAFPCVIWINGSPVGEPVSVQPFEVLTVKMS